MPKSRLVAERRSRPSSVATSTFDSTGRVLRGETALETMLKPWASFSCSTETFIRADLSLVDFTRVYNEWLKISSLSLRSLMAISKSKAMRRMRGNPILEKARSEHFMKREYFTASTGDHPALTASSMMVQDDILLPNVR
jgi:hypothetical protein